MRRAGSWSKFWARPSRAARLSENALMPNSFHFQLQGRGPGRVSTLGASLILARDPYFSFTKSKTKIAQTPTVTGNCAACASRRNDPPLGIAKVSKSIATAVSIPRTSLLFQFIFVLPRFYLPMLGLRTAIGGNVRPHPEEGQRFDPVVHGDGEAPAGQRPFRHTVGNTTRIALLLLIPKTSLKKSLSHLSIARNSGGDL
jgi:hypothetical protein